MMREWIWRQFRLVLPKQWEMLQFSRTLEVGSCTFADRCQFRFEFNWKTVAAPPDHERMLSDYRQRLVEEQEMTDINETAIGPWRGFDGCVDGVWSSRFGRYVEDVKCLIEVVFFWPNPPEKALLKEVLEQIRLLPRQDDQHWKAFGLDVHAAKGLILDECEVKPAMAQMRFNDPKALDHLQIFERLGMVEVWLTGTVREWLDGKQPEKLSAAQTETVKRNGHVIEQVSGALPPMRFPTVGRSDCKYQAAAWICPEDGRLYSLSEIAGPNAAPAELLSSLQCCRGGMSA